MENQKQKSEKLNKKKTLKEIWIWDTHTYFHIGEPLVVIPKNIIKGVRIGGVQKEITYRYQNSTKDFVGGTDFTFDSLTLDLKSSEMDYSRCESLAYGEIFIISLVYDGGKVEDFKLPHYYYNDLHSILKIYEESDVFRISINDKIDTDNGLGFDDSEIYDL